MSDEDLETKIELEEISLDAANERKQQGNDLFRIGEWEGAMTAYRSALGCLPKRIVSVPEPRPAESNSPSNSDEVGDEGQGCGESTRDSKGKAKEDVKTTDEKKEEIIEVLTPAVEQSEREMKTLRAVLNANIAACYLKLGNHKDAVESCTQALLDYPDYVKALERRAACNDTLNTWSSLTSTQEDYNTLLSLVSSPSQLADIQRKLQALKPRLEVAQKREMDEMLGKLKGLGNSILGNFGLSTDNFKFVPNGQGGYSVNFTQ